MFILCDLGIGSLSVKVTKNGIVFEHIEKLREKIERETDTSLYRMSATVLRPEKY